MAQEPQPTALQVMAEIAPKLRELTDQVLFGDIWERPGLSKRDRSLITVSALVALNRTEQLRFHLQRALANGLTREELIEVITHLAFYSGWPTAVSAVMIANEVLKRGTNPSRWHQLPKFLQGHFRSASADAWR
jgi:4-carboxymuconolactone decarboxylase